MKFHDIEEGKVYVLQLCQNKEGIRYSKFVESGLDSDENCVFETTPMTSEFLVSEKGNHLEKFITITDGRTFGFGGHGEWFTQSEVTSMREYDLGLSKTVQWDTPIIPSFAAK